MCVLLDLEVTIVAARVLRGSVDAADALYATLTREEGMRGVLTAATGKLAKKWRVAAREHRVDENGTRYLRVVVTHPGQVAKILRDFWPNDRYAFTVNLTDPNAQIELAIEVDALLLVRAEAPQIWGYVSCHGSVDTVWADVTRALPEPTEPTEPTEPAVRGNPFGAATFRFGWTPEGAFTVERA